MWLVDAILDAKARHRFHVWAWVIMPEHVHLPIWPTVPDYKIDKILSSLKLPVTRRALAFVRKEAPSFLPRMLDRQPNGKVAYRFWQRGGGYDRNITEAATVWAEIHYIHMNPVRRGLCLRPEDWVWSSAADYYCLEPGLIPIDRESLPDAPVR